MRRRGFTLAEVLVALAVISIVGAVSFSLRFADLAEEELVAQEAQSLAHWIESAFLRSQATKEKLFLHGAAGIDLPFRIDWISGEREFYTPSGGVRLLNMASVPLSYSPIGNSNSPFGMTIRVYNKSRRLVRYVIVSRFARVRVSKTAH